MIGSLVKYNYQRGYGQIEHEGGNIFAHCSEFFRSGIEHPTVGATYEFDLGSYNGRDVAIKIKELNRN